MISMKWLRLVDKTFLSENNYKNFFKNIKKKYAYYFR